MYVGVAITMFVALMACVFIYWLANVGYVVHQWARGVQEHYEPLIKAPAYHHMWTVADDGYQFDKMPSTVFQAAGVLAVELFMLACISAFVSLVWPLTLFVSTAILYAFGYRHMLTKKVEKRVKTKAKTQKVK